MAWLGQLKALSLSWHNTTDYINFNERLRSQGDISHLHAMPLVFQDLADLWNKGIIPGDLHRISSITFPKNLDTPSVDLSQFPIPIADFFITSV